MVDWFTVWLVKVAVYGLLPLAVYAYGDVVLFLGWMFLRGLVEEDLCGQVEQTASFEETAAQRGPGGALSTSKEIVHKSSVRHHRCARWSPVGRVGRALPVGHRLEAGPNPLGRGSAGTHSCQKALVPLTANVYPPNVAWPAKLAPPATATWNVP